MPYTWANAKTDCETAGGSCDYQYDQALDIRSIVGGSAVSDGWCHALVIMWLKKNFAGENFLEWFAPAEKACPQRVGKLAAVGELFVTLREVMIDQSTMLRNFNGQANKSWWAVDYALVNCIKKYGITPGKDGIRGFEIGKSATFVVQMMGEISGYSYIRLGANNQVGHAVGVYVAPGKNLYVFFDPNFGQYRFPSETAFIAFLKKFMPRSKYGSDYKRMGILHIADV